MNNDLLYAIIIGLAVGSFIFIAFKSRFEDSTTIKKAVAVGSYSIGLGITWWLYNHPSELSQAMQTIVGRGIAIILAVLAFVLLFYKYL